MTKKSLSILILGNCLLYISCASSEYQLAYRVPLLNNPNKKFILVDPIVKERTDKKIPIGSQFANSSEVISMAKKYFATNKDSIVKSLQVAGNAVMDTDKFSIYRSEADGYLYLDYTKIANFLQKKNATHLVVPFISVINLYNQNIVTASGNRYKIYCPKQNYSVMEFSLVVFTSDGELALDTNEFQSRERPALIPITAIEKWDQKDKHFYEQALIRYFPHNKYIKMHKIYQEGKKCGMVFEETFLKNSFEKMRFDLLKDL